MAKPKLAPDLLSLHCCWGHELLGCAHQFGYLLQGLLRECRLRLVSQFDQRADLRYQHEDVVALCVKLYLLAHASKRAQMFKLAPRSNSSVGARYCIGRLPANTYVIFELLDGSETHLVNTGAPSYMSISGSEYS